MYRGYNQDYIYTQKCFLTHLACMAGEVHPSVLKRVFFGDPFHQEKGMTFLRVLKEIKEITQGENIQGK